MYKKRDSKALKLISFDVRGWKAKNKLKGGYIKENLVGESFQPPASVTPLTHPFPSNPHF